MNLEAAGAVSESGFQTAPTGIYALSSGIRGEQRNPVQGLLRVQPFTPKLVNGRTYWITKAEVSVRTALGSSTRAMGIVFDKIKGREYALSIADFNRFMETGDLSILA